MSRNTEQKAKLLVLYDILCRLTDENHALNSDEIIAELAKHNIEVSRKVLPSDIALLNKYGYEVLSYKKKYHYYYVVNRHFDTAEIAMLADVIKASKLSLEQKSMLIQKLGEMIGNHQAEKISKNIINYDEPKRSNNRIIYSIDAIDRAISEQKKISFLYYSLDAEKKKIYRKEGNRYITNPLVMVWNKDNYYLIAYPDHHNNTITYRIDRMEDVRIEDERIVKKKEFVDFNVEKYRMQVFSMFGGELKEVGLQFVPEMLDDIYDKFGENVSVETVGDKYQVLVQIQISPTFFSWVIGSRGKVHIISPLDVKEQFTAFVDTIKKEY
ncbi:MAG: WYL domain-containing protein [Clostridia bacterium]|nr:WYL domain-containing protein [Clostridia bacterium]